ncbi:MAG: hypothetical protein ACXACC_04475 [Promethearchaeota archaeon]|jgi:hypothetical protein
MIEYFLPIASINDIYSILNLLLIIFILIPIFFLILISIWIYKDAKKREMNAFVWVLIIWVIPFFVGLIVYLKVRDQYSTPRM